MTRLKILLIAFVFVPYFCGAQVIPGENDIVLFSREKNAFPLSAAGKSVPVLISSADYPGVIRAVKDLQTDIGKVTGTAPLLFNDQISGNKEIIIVGTLGKSSLIDKLVKDGKIDVSAIEGKWESYITCVVKKPVPGVKSALIIAGSDKRGTIYGIYDLTEKIGVSPWYWWADVPVDRHDEIYISNRIYVSGPPSVKYRGIFLNDEAPALTNWIIGKYGMVKLQDDPPIPEGVANYGREFYTKLFELLLRLKGNFLWPAMWNNAFNEDDPENPRLADEYGIVMGNSHQEPMLRAQKEWDRRYLRKIGTWNYSKNPDILESFWRDGIRRNSKFESIVTIGLRGANDTPMAPGGPEANMSLLEKIVDVQRNILMEEVNPDITQVPQLWCLYKEVQDFYKAGMRVPDDVTLLWAEDNWGNVRRLPDADERKRPGGAGIYYHFDYHGGPRSYQWLNTNPISKIFDQMSLAKQYGADNIWIVNVGHFKGYEFPMEYFLRLGWRTSSFGGDNIRGYTSAWASREFGSEYADEIAELISKYTMYNGRRKPELLAPSTYSLVNYNEAETVVADYNSLALKAEDIYNKLDVSFRDAFYQLVLFPVKACALVNELYVAAGKNNLYSQQKRASTGDMETLTKTLFTADTTLMGYYNRDFAGGKWNHFMDQAHLGYTSWADPPVNSLRAIRFSTYEAPDSAIMGVAVEGSETNWAGSLESPVLPQFDIFNKQSRYIEVFNSGTVPFDYTISPSETWIKISEKTGKIQKEKRIEIGIDWTIIPKGKSTGNITITGAGTECRIQVDAFDPENVTPSTLKGFAESDGYISIEAEHYTGKTDMGERKWVRIEDYGHTLSGMRANTDTDCPSLMPGNNSPSMEYQSFFFTAGEIEITSILSPTLNFMPGRGLKYAISVDDEPPQIITAVPDTYNAQNGNRDWEESVRNNARFCKSKHQVTGPGYHTIKFWMVDPGVILQKIVVNTGGLRTSYLGPPESFRNN